MSSTTSDDAPTAEPLGPPMSFREHLAELRKRLVRITIVLLVGTFLTWEFKEELFEFLSRPVANALADNGIYHFQTIHLTESIVVFLKVTLVGALFLCSPYVFFELWGFIAPGLYKREKRFIIPLTAFSVIFFLIGSAFAYTIIIPFITDWLVNLSLNSGPIDVTVTLQNAYSFSFMFLVMFGLVFELPLVLFFLALWGLVTAKGLLKFWRYFVVISFIVCGILTPPDPLSQTLMAVPVNVLYGFGVVVALTVGRARAKDATNVSQRAIRAMALSLLGVVALTIGFFLIITGLPRAPIHAWGPPDTVVTVGLNPRVLAAEKSVLGLVRADPDAAATLDALVAAGGVLEDITDGALVVDAAGQRAVMLRGDGLGALAPAIVKSLSGRVGVRALDEDSLAFGAEPFLATLAPRSVSRSDDDGRLLARLLTAGPVWLYVDKTATADAARATLVGRENADDLGAFGGSLALTGAGGRRQLTFDLPITKAKASPVEARIEAARVAALARSGDARQTLVVSALTTIAHELEALAPADAKTRLEAVTRELERLRPEAPAATFPALLALAPHLRGVSVRRDERRINVTSELADEGLDALFAWLRGARPQG